MKRITGPLFSFHTFEKYPIKTGFKKVRDPEEFALQDEASGKFVPIKDYEARVLQAMKGTKTFDELVDRFRGFDDAS